MRLVLPADFSLPDVDPPGVVPHLLRAPVAGLQGFPD